LYLFIAVLWFFTLCRMFGLFRRFGDTNWLLPCDWPTKGGWWRELVKENIPNTSYKSEILSSP